MLLPNESMKEFYTELLSKSSKGQDQLLWESSRNGSLVQKVLT